MVKIILIAVFISLAFFQCSQSDAKSFQNNNANVNQSRNTLVNNSNSESNSFPLSEETLLGIWKGTEHNTDSIIFLNFKKNNELEALLCGSKEERFKLEYDFYQHDDRNAIIINNELFGFTSYPWLNEFNQLRFSYEDTKGPGAKGDRPTLTFFVYKKAEKMSCEDKK